MTADGTQETTRRHTISCHIPVFSLHATSARPQ